MNPTKVVAGLEADDTNVFLHKLHEACLKFMGQSNMPVVGGAPSAPPEALIPEVPVAPTPMPQQFAVSTQERRAPRGPPSSANLSSNLVFNASTTSRAVVIPPGYEDGDGYRALHLDRASSDEALAGFKLGKFHRHGTDSKQDKLEEGVQMLCQAVHPLGKLMDSVQLDLGIMDNELAYWEKENERYSALLQSQQKESGLQVAEMYEAVKLVEEDIKAKKQRIRDTKALITRNEAEIGAVISQMFPTT
eukprot:Platyproteum_vivax@DN4889_c0_g1_i1.p1